MSVGSSSTTPHPDEAYLAQQSKEGWIWCVHEEEEDEKGEGQRAGELVQYFQ